MNLTYSLTTSSPKWGQSTNAPAGIKWLQAGIFSVLMMLGTYSSPTSANTHVSYNPPVVTSSVPRGHFDGAYGITTSSALLEIRRVTGATWEELSELFDVSTRSIHFWANGKTLSSANERRVYDMLSAVRSIDAGSVSEVRSLLFSKQADGMSLFDHMKSGNFDHVALNKYPAINTRKYTPLNAAASRMRLPLNVGVSLAGQELAPVPLSEKSVRKTLRRLS